MAEHSEQRGWTCRAYSKGTMTVTCFFQAMSVCVDEPECDGRMVAERKRVFRDMQAMSALDPMWADIAADFPTPESLLGGDDVEPSQGY